MKNLEMEQYGVMSLSFEEMEGIDGGVMILGGAKMDMLKKGAKWVFEKAVETCAGNCVASWCEGFVGEMFN